MLEKKSELLNTTTIYYCKKCGYKKHVFEDILKQKREKTMKVEFEYLDKEVKKASEIEREEIEKKHWEIVSDYVKRGGKHLRSTLILLSNKALGGEEEKAMKTAAAMEICENWILIHDDIEDDSQSRRGDKTLHLKYGKELAINAGDALHLIMWKILRDNENILGDEKTFKIIDEFYEILFRTTVGQTAELIFMEKPLEELKEEDFYYIADGKTGLYSIAGPLVIGSIIAGKESKEITEKYMKFGKYLGRAFQITDDVLDLTSDFKGLKKQKANDIYEGKRTMMLIHLIKNANDEEKIRIKKIMAKPREEKSKEEVDYILTLMKKYGSIDYAMNKAREFTRKAFECFKEMNFFENEEGRKELMLAIDFIINRDF